MQRAIYKITGKEFKIIEENEERIVLANDKGLAKSIKPRSFKNLYVRINKEDDNE